MSAYKARKALDENLKEYISARKDPVMWNLHIALKELADDIGSIKDGLVTVSRQVDQVARRLPR